MQPAVEMPGPCSQLLKPVGARSAASCAASHEDISAVEIPSASDPMPRWRHSFFYVRKGLRNSALQAFRPDTTCQMFQTLRLKKQNAVGRTLSVAAERAYFAPQSGARRRRIAPARRSNGSAFCTSSALNKIGYQFLAINGYQLFLAISYFWLSTAISYFWLSAIFGYQR